MNRIGAQYIMSPLLVYQGSGTSIRFHMANGGSIVIPVQYRQGFPCKADRQSSKTLNDTC